MTFQRGSQNTGRSSSSGLHSRVRPLIPVPLARGRLEAPKMLTTFLCRRYYGRRHCLDDNLLGGGSTFSGVGLRTRWCCCRYLYLCYFSLFWSRRESLLTGLAVDRIVRCCVPVVYVRRLHTGRRRLCYAD